MAGSKVLEFIIGAKDATAGAIGSAVSRVKDMAKSIFKNLANIKAGFDILAAGVRTAMSLLKKSLEFETTTYQCKTLIGNMDEARRHMEMLKELGATPPFSLEQFAKASRSLMVMTDGVLGYKHSLELIGDAAAETGVDIDQLGHEVGRLFAIIRDGQPITRATMALRNMGVITPEVAAKLEEMQKKGSSALEIWDEFEKCLGRFNGAMKETENTGNGLIGAIQSQWDESVRTFGDAFMDAAKGGMGSLLETMKQLNEDGTIAYWAEETVEWLETVIDSVNYVGKVCGKVFSTIWDGIKATLGSAWAFAAGADQKFNEQQGWQKFNLWQQMKAGGRVAAQYWDDQFGEGADKAEQEEREFRENRRAELRRKHEEWANKRREADEDKAHAKEMTYERERALLVEAHKEGQRKTDERKAREAAEKEAKKYEKAYNKWVEACAKQEERERLALERAIAKERERLWRAEIKEYEKAYKQAVNDDREAQRWLADAQQAEAQAWGWYRDRDSWNAQLEEERANAEAEKQFEKDWHSLTHRSGWRTAKLSDDQEIVRRVGLAREERAAAEQYAKQTAEATERAAEALEAIQTAFEEGSAE